MNPNSISFPSASSSTAHQSADPARRTAEARAAFEASLKSTGASSITTELYSRAENLHANSKALTKQDETLQKETKTLAKENDSLEKLLDKTAKDFQGLKDFEALMADLEADFGLIEETLRLAEADDQDEVDLETQDHLGHLDQQPHSTGKRI